MRKPDRLAYDACAPPSPWNPGGVLVCNALDAARRDHARRRTAQAVIALAHADYHNLHPRGWAAAAHLTARAIRPYAAAPAPEPAPDDAPPPSTRRR